MKGSSSDPFPITRLPAKVKETANDTPPNERDEQGGRGGRLRYCTHLLRTVPDADGTGTPRHGSRDPDALRPQRRCTRDRPGGVPVPHNRTLSGSDRHHHGTDILRPGDGQEHLPRTRDRGIRALGSGNGHQALPRGRRNGESCGIYVDTQAEGHRQGARSPMGPPDGMLQEAQGSGDTAHHTPAPLHTLVGHDDPGHGHPLRHREGRHIRKDEVRGQEGEEGLREQHPLRRVSEMQEELREAEDQMQMRIGARLPRAERVRDQEAHLQQRTPDPLRVREEVRAQNDLPLLRIRHRDQGGHPHLHRHGGRRRFR